MDEHEARISAVGECIRLANEPVVYDHRMPCPDGQNCLVNHTVPWKRPKTCDEILRDLTRYHDECMRSGGLEPPVREGWSGGIPSPGDKAFTIPAIPEQETGDAP